MDVIDVIVSASLSMGLTWLLVAGDRLTLSPAQRARGWNSASTGAAIFAFSPLCIVAHFWVTRRSVLGLLQGSGWLVVLTGWYLVMLSLTDLVGLLWLAALLVLAPLSPLLAAVGSAITLVAR